MNEFNLKKLDTIVELTQLTSVFSSAFASEYKVDESYLNELLADSKAIIIGAKIDEKIVGGLVAFEMTPLHGSRELYIYDIAVIPAYQRQGLGTQLIAKLKQEALALGIQTIFVEAEADDEGAVAFYRSLAGEEIVVNHFNFKLNMK